MVPPPKNPLPFKHGVAVRHAGDVVAHDAVQTRLARLAAGLPADFLGMLQIKMEKVPQKLPCPEVRLVDKRIEVKILIKVTTQFEVQPAAFRAVFHERLGAAPRVIGGRHAGGADQPFAGDDDILDLQVNDGADDEVTALCQPIPATPSRWFRP